MKVGDYVIVLKGNNFKGRLGKILRIGEFIKVEFEEGSTIPESTIYKEQTSLKVVTKEKDPELFI